ncbi:MAG: hypothetical protein ACYDAR_21050, partial [Thermomicrobiales bacterium]
VPFKPKSTPVIRATLAAMDAVNALRDVRLDTAQNDTERERVQTEHRGLLFVLAEILRKEQCGPPSPAPTGLRLVRPSDD